MTWHKTVRGRIICTDKRANRFKDALEGLVCNPVLEGNVDAISLALSSPSIQQVPRSREVLPKFVEATRQHSVGGVKRFFDPIAVMTIYVDVQYSGECAEKVKDTEDNVINVAETRSFAFFGVM